MAITKEAIVEAALFAAEEPITLQMIADMLAVTKESARQIIEYLSVSYQAEDKGIQIVKIADGFQVCTKKETYPYLAKIKGLEKKPAISNAMLEVLSIIAYKQPVTKKEIVSIRGVNCDKAVNRLIEYGLIEEAGRQETIGRPILLRTTKEFLRHFGISDLIQLPKLFNPESL